MEFLRNKIRFLLGFDVEDSNTRTNSKRDRNEDEASTDEDSPALKRLKSLKRTQFPDIMSMNDDWEKKEKQNVRYVPIQVEAGHPSTSTPNVRPERLDRVRTVPIKMVEAVENGPGTPGRKPRVHTPVRPVIHAVIDDDDDDEDDDEPEIRWVKAKPAKKTVSQSKPKVYINLDEDEENECDQPDDVVFVTKITSPPPKKPYKYFVSKNNSVNDAGRVAKSPQYYRLLPHRKLTERNVSTSPILHNKFKAPQQAPSIQGITKPYRKTPSSLPKWMNGRSTLSEIFNLNEKRNYQELIRRVSDTTKPISMSKPLEIINLSDDAASFRSTQRSQKKALDEIRFVERGLNAQKDNEATQEYDPVTVASLNSSDSEIEIVPSPASTTSSQRIDPVNSLKESHKDCAITSNDWLAKLNSKYRKKRLDTQEKLKDVRRENDIISKVNYEQKLAHLEHKLKYELSIPESLIEEPQATVELPPLTPEQEKLVNRALGPGPPGQLLVEKFNLRIHRRDLQTLAGLNWLNDEVINFYMNLLMQRSEERKDLPKVYATNTFFYPKLMQSGQSGLRRWTRKVDIFAHDLLVIPVHLGVHWCLSLVDFRAKRVLYLDSMGGRNQPCLDALRQYLRDEHKDKKGQPFDEEGWSAESISKSIPQQMNGSDCGMFACTFAEFSARNAPYTFSQQHMPYLRRKAALEILQGRLLL